MNNQKRQGRRAPGVRVVSIPMPESLKNELRALADRDQTTLARFVRLQMQALVRRSLAARRAAA